MKTKIILLLIIAITVVGCKTVKQAQSVSRTNTTQNSTVKASNVQNNDVSLKVDSSKLTIDKGQVSEMVNEETTTTNYSTPDSVGKQHITSVTTTKRGVTRNEAKNLQEKKQNRTNLVDKSDFKSDSSVNNKTSAKSSDNQKVVATTSTKTPAWIYIVVVVIIIIVVLFYRKSNWFISAISKIKNILSIFK
jgi:cobalamin biosynthesis Mg chelatase CobN